jgi:GNAT superfamily N-acetyltransferase
MILLEKEKFRKVLEPLNKVTMNVSFAYAVVEKYVSGLIYTDDVQNPQTFYIVHPYGLSLLLGNSGNPDFNEKFKNYALNVKGIRNRFEWMQAFDAGWYPVLNELFGECLVKSADHADQNGKGIIELNTRVNFRFNHSKYLDFKSKNSPAEMHIVPTDRQLYGELKGSVIPACFWDSADDFCSNGVGFSLLYKGEPASTAFSACLENNRLEIGIETLPEYRGLGLARHTCARIIDYCLEHKYEPVWSCRLENTGSYNLAQRMGFEPTLELPFYRLSN